MGESGTGGASGSGPRQDGRARRAQRERQSRRAQLLAAARGAFSSRGYHATSVGDIINAAGVARGTFYLHFVGKRAVFDEIVDGFFALLAQRVRPVDMAPGAPPPAAQLGEICRHILATLTANADLTRILLREAAGVDAEFDDKLHQFYDRILDLIQHALETGATLGLVRVQTPPLTNARPLAHMVLGSVKELVAWLLAAGERGELVDLDAAVNRLVAFNLGAAMTPNGWS